MKKQITIVLIVALILFNFSFVIYADESNSLNVTINEDKVTISGNFIKTNSFVTLEVKRVTDGSRKYIKQTDSDSRGNFSFPVFALDKGNYIAIVSCGYEQLQHRFDITEEPVEKELLSISAEKTTYDLKVGEESDIKIIAKYSDGSIEDVTEQATYTSSEIAKVENGVIKTLKQGETEITVKYLNQKEIIKVTVTNQDTGSSNNNKNKNKNTKESKEDLMSGNAIITKDSSGRVKVVVEVEKSKLEKKLNDKGIKKVVIEVKTKEKADETTVNIDSDIIKKAKENGKTLAIDNGEAVVEIDSSTIEVEERTEISLKISKVDEEKADELFKKKSSNEFSPASYIIDFDLISVKGKKEEKLKVNKPLTIKIKFDSKKVKDTRKVGIYYYNEDSKVWEFVGGKVTSKGTIEVEVSHFSKYAAMEYNKTFADVNIPWAKEQIEVLVSKHVINGVDDNNYSPNADITRAEFAKLLVKALNLKKGENIIQFNDIEAGTWYEESVEIASSLEIVKGSGGKFDPNGKISREAMAVMIVRALKQVAPDGSYTVKSLNFEDMDTISDWAKEEVSIAANKGLVNGVSSTEFAPKENATRAQAAVIIYRILELLDRI